MESPASEPASHTRQAIEGIWHGDVRRVEAYDADKRTASVNLHLAPWRAWLLYHDRLGSVARFSPGF